MMSVRKGKSLNRFHDDEAEEDGGTEAEEEKGRTKKSTTTTTTVTTRKEREAQPDVRTLGIVRSMDLIMYVLYSDDQKFVQDLVTKAGKEVAQEQQCDELQALLEQYTTHPQMYRCLFFLLLDFHPKFRFWVLAPLLLHPQFVVRDLSFVFLL